MEKKDKKSFQVLMFGPDRVGKSSILASMVDQLEEVKKKTGGELTLTPNLDAKMLLDSKKASLQKLFDGLKSLPEQSYIINEGATNLPYSYDFTLAVKDVEETIGVTFVDINGEMVKNDTDRATLSEYMRDSSVIMVAIDTPHLMECNGDYNEPVNNLSNVTTLFQILTGRYTGEEPRLILFVPVKCEKYYHENRMDEVNQKIKEKYRNIFALFSKGQRKEKYMVAITPIFTLGDVVFDDFKRDEKGNVLCLKKEAIYDENNKFVGYKNEYIDRKPLAAFYKFYGDNPVFSPKYCEQPLLHALNFIMQLAKLEKKPSLKNETQEKKSIMQVAIKFVLLTTYLPFYAIYKLFTLNKKMQKAVNLVTAEVKTEGDGYEIIQDPLNKEEK